MYHLSLSLCPAQEVGGGLAPDRGPAQGTLSPDVGDIQRLHQQIVSLALVNEFKMQIEWSQVTSD